MTEDSGYVDYRILLELPERYKPADVIRTYKKKMKKLVIEISQREVSQEQRDQYLLRMAQLNVAFHIFRNRQRGEIYLRERDEVIRLEEEWHAVAAEPKKSDILRRQYDQSLRNFLAKYMEDMVLEAGRDSDCIEHSGWDAAHERHAGRILRQNRQQLYHKIHERLPYYEITSPAIDWTERSFFVDNLLERTGV
ncbi:MAG: hypothetical protein KAH38_04425 [Candidatus Hydrogenedentes bacterium]|nr:hypothetical protein [Candidatus Hydrogenedentota bacterium]